MTYEYIMQDILSHIHKLFEHLGFQGGVPGASACEESVQGVVELNYRRKGAIPYHCHRIPKDLNQPDAA